MHKSSKVAIVILNWNGAALLRQFLPILIEHTDPSYQLVVGDNASTDDSVELLSNDFPNIRIIKNNSNHGFAGGYNEVLKMVDAEYYILLNSDVAVTANWTEPIIRELDVNQQIAVVQPKIKSYRQNNKFEYAGAAGGMIDFLGYPFCRGRLFDEVEEDHGQYNNECEIFWASGCAMFIRSSVFWEVGGFDAQFFAHMEEIDLCWRIKNRGYKIVYQPAVSIFHVGGATLNQESPQKTFLNFRNNHFLLKKNLPGNVALWVIPVRFCLDFVTLIKFALERKWRHAVAISKAHQAFVAALWKGNIKTEPHTKQPRELSGMHPKSVVWQYFILKKKKFDEL